MTNAIVMTMPRNRRSLEELAYRLEHGYTRHEVLTHDYRQELSLQKWAAIARNSMPTPWQKRFEVRQALRLMKRMMKEDNDE